MSNMPKEPSDGGSDASPKRGQSWILVPLAICVLLALLFFNAPSGSPITYSFFQDQLDANNVEYLILGDVQATGSFKVPPDKPALPDAEGKLEPPKPGKNGELPKYTKQFRVSIPTEASRNELIEKLDGIRAKNEEFMYDLAQPGYSEQIVFLLFLALPIIAIVIAWTMLRRTRDQFMGGNFLSGFTRSTAKRYQPSEQRITFADVAGLEGVKADLQEIVDFLKSPEKFQKLGGRVPKGVLLNGPPGTGKTLLARAVAGEAGVSFYSVNGSEFIQMFVGVGASRVRDLFQQAKENGPSIVFIDEIDAVGRQRGAGLGGGHDEREQTLNQILSEMDGFSQVDSVIVMAATNRPDVLDPALLRPGRFDRHITVGRPTLKGRIEIFKVHVRDVPLDDDVDITRLAEGTVGLTGADIRNIVNEAALWAARSDHTRVTMADFDYARDKVLMGAKREEAMSPVEKKKTAYHEAGHTLGAWFLPGSQRVHKVTIIPRGRSLGSTHIVPSEDRLSITESEIRDQLIVLLAGRAAEKIIYSETTAGAESDLERATGLARRMVSHWGMSSKLGPVSYKLSEEDPFLGREIHQQRQFSEHTQEVIDAEVGQILHQADQHAMELLRSKSNELQALTDALMVREELSEKEITELIGPSIHAQNKAQEEATDAPEPNADGEGTDPSSPGSVDLVT